MENKINVAELLKDCPKGMELDCTCADNAVFDKIIEYEQIKCVIGECRDSLILDKYGRLLHICCPKCVIFPKGKTTWEGFQRPFNDGDIVISSLGGIHILKNSTTSYCYFDRMGLLDTTLTNNIRVIRFATEEEKQKLFDAIKANGYKWNAETKTLEKLVVPKFKVGDRIRRDDGDVIYTINGVYSSMYGVEERDFGISIEDQDDYELVPNEFDITTLKPFESRVLVRNADGDLWKPAIYGFSHSKGCYVVGGVYWGQCIPYEANKELLGTTDDCDNFL